jgi:glycosyltransferase involved in cell wall biosynthesis
MIPISGILIVKNEELTIERALTSLLWCDEIIVVDSGSTDQTKSICQNPHTPWAKKIKWVEQSWLGFSKQRNFASGLAKNQWVFFLDGDEACSPELAIRLQSLAAQPSGLDPAVYRIRRQEFFLKQPIHYSIWNPSYQDRFFPKSNAQFTKDVHEGLQSQLSVKKIQEAIIHRPDLTIERILDKMNHYTTLQAENDYQGGLRTNTFRILMAFPSMFYKNFFYYRGYRDGYAGFIISCLEGISRLVRHLKIWQLQRLNQKQN